MQANDRIAALCRAVRSGDEAAFEEMYRMWFDRVYAMARATGAPDESACLDLCQETFLRVVRKLPECENGAALHAWLSRVVKRCAMDAERGRRRRRARERVAWEGSLDSSGAKTGTSADDAASREQAAWLNRGMASLSEVESKMVRARFVEGKPLSAMDGGRGVAHGVIRRAMSRLRRMAKEVFNGD